MGKLNLTACIAGLVGLAATIPAVTPAAAGTLDDILARGELRVAVQTQGPPFSFMDKNGQRTGSAIELTTMMAEAMGVKVTYLDFDWDGLLPALLSGKADMLAADMTPTLARATKVAFTKPFIYVGAVAFVSGKGDLKSVEDCKKPGTTWPSCLARRARNLPRPCSPRPTSSPSRAAERCCLTRSRPVKPIAG